MYYYDGMKVILLVSTDRWVSLICYAHVHVLAVSVTIVVMWCMLQTVCYVPDGGVC